MNKRDKKWAEGKVTDVLRYAVLFATHQPPVLVDDVPTFKEHHRRALKMRMEKGVKNGA